MGKYKMSMLARLVYGIVGLTGLGSLIWAIMFWGTFLEMPFWSIFAFILCVIGSLNWGIVAVTRDRKKDLFGLLGI